MKLGTETGSLTNWLIGEGGTPVVGEGATEFMWTDRHVFTVVEVSADGKRCVIQEDNAKPLFSGMTDSQSYEYSPNPEGYKKELFYRWGAWRTKSEHGNGWPKINIRFGYRSKYYDFSF